jgi:hypothetical protein
MSSSLLAFDRKFIGAKRDVFFRATIPAAAVTAIATSRSKIRRAKASTVEWQCSEFAKRSILNRQR